VDRLDEMALFVRVVERKSFHVAATDLGLQRSTASEMIKRLEGRLGMRLLQRTTRHVAPTLEGEAFYRRCLQILADIEEAETAFSDARPRGVLRIDVHGNMFRQLLLPHLPAFLSRYPELSLHIGEGDRLVNLIQEGVDCVVRAGEPADSGMVLRRLGMVNEATVASPDYLARHCVPMTPDDLDCHMMIGFVSSATSEVMPLEFTQDGQVRYVRLPSRMTVTGSDTSAALARLGLGLVQAPRYRFADDFASGALVEVLAEYPPTPTPISALYPHNRQLSPRVRVFVDWLIQVFDEQAFQSKSLP
jgi:DNA-binding transcriptional LysR family regulator